MDKYIFIEHTADSEFKAFGKTLDEAFANAALALTDVVIDVKEVNCVEQKKITIESESKEALLYDFLEKVLILIDSDHYVIGKVVSLKIEQGTKFKLSAVVTGDYGVEKYDYKTQVKAVTYNDMRIEEKPGSVMVQVVLDL